MRTIRSIRTIRFATAGLLGIAALGACAPTPGGENPGTTAAPTTAAPTTTVPTGPVSGAIGGTYKVRYANDATASIKVAGDTITVVAGPGLRVEGASCTLPTNTVLAILTGSGSRYTGSHWGFTATCAPGSRYSSVADLNADGSVSLTSPTGTHLFTKTANAPTPAPEQLAATYDVAYGSAGRATAHVSGAVVTLSVSDPFTAEASASCSLPNGRVIAMFEGTGTRKTGSHWGFSPTTCFTGSRYSATMYVNGDRSLTVDGPFGPHLFAHRSSVTTSSVVDATGSYRTRYATSGTLDVVRSGTNHTVSVGTGFTVEGASCTLAPTTVVATFAGSGIEMSGSHWGFDATTCTTGSRYSSTVNLNSDRSITMTGPTGPHLLERI